MGTEEFDEVRLTAIGVRVNAMMLKAREALGEITPDELNAFAQSIETTETIGPLLDPTAYMRLPHDAFKRVRKRVEIAKFVLEDVEGGSNDPRVG